MRWFRAVVSAICYSIIAEEPLPKELPAAAKNTVVRFVDGEIFRCPLHLRAPLFIATLGIDLMALVFGGALLHRCDSEKRQRVMNRIFSIPIGPIGEVLKFYQSLALLSAWDEFERG